MQKINENTMAKLIAEYEGKASQVSIAQVKEIQKLMLDYLAQQWLAGNEAGVIELIKKHIM